MRSILALSIWVSLNIFAEADMQLISQFRSVTGSDSTGASDNKMAGDFGGFAETVVVSQGSYSATAQQDSTITPERVIASGSSAIGGPFNHCCPYSHSASSDFQLVFEMVVPSRFILTGTLDALGDYGGTSTPSLETWIRLSDQVGTELFSANKSGGWNGGPITINESMVLAVGVYTLSVAATAAGSYSGPIEFDIGGGGNANYEVELAFMPVHNLTQNTWHTTIQEAIGFSVNGDELVVHPGTYLENINFIGKNIVLTGTDPNDPNTIANTVIDGQQNGSVVTFSGMEDPNCILAGFTITNGLAETGGGISCIGSSPTIRNCTIVANKTLDGTVLFTTFTNGGDGAGIYCYSSSATIYNCTLNQNSTGSGVGPGGYNGTDGGRGAGICCLFNSEVTITNCTISGNSTGNGGEGLSANGGNGGDGAGIYCSSSTANITQCLIMENKTGHGLWADFCNVGGQGGSGAGIYGTASSSLIVTNCLLGMNGTGNGGGATCVDFPFPADGGDGGDGAAILCDLATITNCTIVHNATGLGGSGAEGGNNGLQGQGGGIYGSNNTTIINTILWNNTPDSIYGHDCANVTYCDISDAICQNLNGNISADPLFTDFDGPDGDPNTWEDNDYHLKSQAGHWDPITETWILDAVTSPAIDAGDPNADWTAEPFPHGSRINLGVYGGTTEASRTLHDARRLLSEYTAEWPTEVTIQVNPGQSTTAYAVEDSPPQGWVVSAISGNGVWDEVTGKVKWGPFFDNQSRVFSYDATPPTGTIGCHPFSGVLSFNGISQPVLGDADICEGPKHPADSDENLCLVINEMTAYGSCWKTGCTWPVEPNPIPIGYVTRAGFLWKSGECYHFDGSFALPESWQPNVAQASASAAGEHAEVAWSFAPPCYTTEAPLAVDPSTLAL